MKAYLASYWKSDIEDPFNAIVIDVVNVKKKVDY
jgi:hypothetical protein